MPSAKTPRVRKGFAARDWFIRSGVGALALLGLFLAQAVPAHAVPASPDYRTLTQPDGTRFEARLWGDEWRNGWETRTGHTVVFDTKAATWVYAESDARGGLRASSKVVGKDLPPAGMARHLRPTGSQSQDSALRRSQAARVAPATGVNNVLTILVNYSDTSFTHAPAEFEKMLFGSGNFSMSDYYEENSYGQLTVKAGPAGVRGWYRADFKSEFGGRYWSEPAYFAAKAADLDGVDFAPYDQDGDCFVDVIAVVHQGEGRETTGDVKDVWSHRWSLDEAFKSGFGGQGIYVTQTPCRKGGHIKINDYIIQPERQFGGMVTVGVFAHEYGHALGLPDLYDIDGSSEGIGSWSGMATGSWNRVAQPGDRPGHFDPWSKYWLGWLKPVKVVSAQPSTRTILPAYAHASAMQFGDGDPLSGKGEYFLVENRNKSGFDAGLPGGGLLIWHVDEAMPHNAWECIPGKASCAAQHYKVALVQADGKWDLESVRSRGDAGDAFPGSSRKSTFNDDTNPSARLYSGSRSNVRISSIAINGKIAVASMAYGVPTVTRYVRYTASGPGIGTVSFSPEGTLGACGTSCKSSFGDGSVVTLTATPAPGSAFAGWSGNRVCSGTGPCTLTMTKNMSVTGSFRLLPTYPLNYTRAGTGSGTVSFAPAGTLTSCTKKCANRFPEGTVVTLTATPATGSTFAGWSGSGGCSGKGSCSVTMAKATSVIATFSKLISAAQTGTAGAAMQ